MHRFKTKLPETGCLFLPHHRSGNAAWQGVPMALLVTKQNRKLKQNPDSGEDAAFRIKNP